jgi:hypothetical protein
MFMLSFIFLIVCGLLGVKGNLRFFKLFVYICFAVGDPIINEVRFEIPLAGLTPPHFVPVLI